MKLRDKLLVPIGLALLGVLAINLGALWAASSSWSDVDARRVAGHVLQSEVQLAAVAFKQQVQEWKNVLLRGEDPADRQRHHRAFLEREDEVHDRLNAIAAAPSASSWTRAEASDLLERHRQLGRRYREALGELGGPSGASPLLVDRRVRGIDRALTERLSGLGQRVQAEALEDVERAVQQGRWRVGGLVAGAILLSLSIVGLMLIVVHRLVVRPAQAASELSRHLLDPTGGDLSLWTTTMEDASDDELGQLFRTLTQLHQDLQAEREHLAEAQSELERARLAVATADETRQAFLARITHELRTPLNGVAGSLDLMRNERMTEDQRVLLAAADTSTQRLATLVEDILEFTQISGGDLELQIRGFDVVAMLEGIVESHRRTSGSSDCVLNFVSEPGPLRIQADQPRLARVISELIDNALHATPAGCVEVRLATAPAEEGVRLCIDVIDDGPGIPEALREAIFQPFTQVDEVYTRDKEGAGLGLSTCRRLVSCMGGQLHHASVTGGGSHFRIELVVDVAPADDTSSLQGGSLMRLHEPVPAQVERPAILIIGAAAVALSEELPFATHQVDDLPEALRALEQRDYPLTLVDVSSVGVGSVVDLRAMTDSAGHLTALVALAHAEDRDLCLGDGWDDVVLADASPPEAREVLDRWLTDDVLLAS